MLRLTYTYELLCLIAAAVELTTAVVNTSFVQSGSTHSSVITVAVLVMPVFITVLIAVILVLIVVYRRRRRSSQSQHER